MHRIKIVGAGQLGSRHLQALKAVKSPLEIHVIDPSETSLKVAQERYDAIPSGVAHRISFTTDFPVTGATDIAIVATHASVRRQALESLLATSEIKYAILEKLLFTSREDYRIVSDLLANKKISTWVNCPMRVMPGYENIKAQIGTRPILYRVTGSQFGLVTNAIHYLDHVVHLSGCNEFVLDVSGLDSTPIASKRAGYLELNGTLVAHFSDGSRCEMTCYPTGNAPMIVEIFTPQDRYIVRESEGKLWHSSERSQWQWQEQNAPIPYQSQMTSVLIEQLLAYGECGLTPYSISAKTHLTLLEPLFQQVRLHNPDITTYPFT